MTEAFTKPERDFESSWKPRDAREQENAEQIRELLRLANEFLGRTNDPERSAWLKTQLQKANSPIQRATLLDLTKLLKDPTLLDYKFVPKGKAEYGELLWYQSENGQDAWAVRHELVYDSGSRIITNRLFGPIKFEGEKSSEWKIKTVHLPLHLRRSNTSGHYNIVHYGKLELLQ